jgi:hypothetical protein
MIERGEVEPYFGCGCGDPATQLEKRHQAFPPTRLLAFSKVMITDPHPQIGESDLQQGHDLVFGII